MINKYKQSEILKRKKASHIDEYKYTLALSDDENHDGTTIKKYQNSVVHGLDFSLNTKTVEGFEKLVIELEKKLENKLSLI